MPIKTPLPRFGWLSGRIKQKKSIPKTPTTFLGWDPGNLPDTRQPDTPDRSFMHYGGKLPMEKVPKEDIMSEAEKARIEELKRRRRQAGGRRSTILNKGIEEEAIYRKTLLGS